MFHILGTVIDIVAGIRRRCNRYVLVANGLQMCVGVSDRGNRLSTEKSLLKRTRISGRRLMQTVNRCWQPPAARDS